MKKSSLISAAVLAIVTLALLITIPILDNKPVTDDNAFRTMTDELFRSELMDNTLSMHYTLANPQNYGITGYKPTLGHISSKTQKENAVLTENTLHRLDKIDASMLSEKNQITYDILKDYLTLRNNANELLLYPEVVSPSSGMQSELPVLLAEYKFRTKQDIIDYLGLLADIPSYFGEIADYEQERASAGLFMCEESAREVISQCQTFVNVQPKHYMETTFESRVADCSFLSEKEKSSCISKNKEYLEQFVYPAYRQLAWELEQLAGRGVNNEGLSHFPQGKQYYEYLVAANTGSSRSIAEIQDLLTNQLKTDLHTLTTIIKTNGAAVETTGNTPSTVSPELILEDLKSKITSDFPIIEEMPYEVKYVDPSLEEFLSPAFYLTPAIDDTTSNVIYINDISGYSQLNLYTTLAHEGYPGHLYQSVYDTLNQQDSPLIRNILYFGGFVEGWALYVEMYSYDLAGADDMVTALSRLDRSLQLCIYSLLDIGIHYEGWSLEDATAFLTSIGSFSEENCKNIYRYIVDEPANYLRYYVGYLEICNLRDYAVEKLGNTFVLKDFHEFLLSTGPAPFNIIKEREDIWIQSCLSNTALK